MTSASFLGADDGSNADEVNSVSADELPVLLSSSLRFDGEDTAYGYRGSVKAPFFTTDINLSKSLCGNAKIYIGNENGLYIKDADDNGYDFYVGGAYNFAEYLPLTLDLRYTNAQLGGNRKAVRDGGGKTYRHVVRLLFKFNVLLKPSLAYAHNFTLGRDNIKLGLGHNFDLGSSGLSGFSLTPSAHCGWARTEKPGTKSGRFKAGGDLAGKQKSGPYWGAGVDLGYEFNPNLSASIGVNWQGANRKKHYLYKGHKNTVWFSSSLDASF
ncbi:MAG: hypothetical protein LBT57_01890 [Puniceicoccales bacterium]|jgi:hypothetical protein|nr:hypothetical protein [Puniceicoccales bacterium]